MRFSIRDLLWATVVVAMGLALRTGATWAADAPQPKCETEDDYYQKHKSLVRFESDFWEPLETGGRLKCHVRFYKTSPILIPGNNFCIVEVLPEGQKPIRLTLHAILVARTMSITLGENGGAAFTAGSLTFSLNATRIKLIRDEFYEPIYKEALDYWQAAPDQRCLNLLGFHRSEIPYDYILERLHKLPGLKRLEVGFPVSDGGLAAIGKISSLEELTVSRHWNKDASLVQLANCQRLRKLELRIPSQVRKVEDDLFTRLSQLRSLESLEFGIMLPNDFGSKGAIGPLAHLPNLRELNISAGAIDDAGLGTLSEVRSLRKLNVGHGEGLSVQAIEFFRRKRPDCELIERRTWPQSQGKRVPRTEK